MAIHETVNQIDLLFFYCSKSRGKDKKNEKHRRKDFNGRRRNQQLQNKRKKLISQQKEEARKKRDRRLYEKGGVFESIFTKSKELTKDSFQYIFPSLHYWYLRFYGYS